MVDSTTLFRLVIGCGFEPFAGTGAAAVFVVVVLPGTRLAVAVNRPADGAETALARADADPGVGPFLIGAALVAVVEAGRVADRGARVVGVV